MNYVKHLNFSGVEAKEIPCLCGTGAPSTSTAGAVGCFYMNTSNGKVYKCTAANAGVYTWSEFGTSGATARIGEVTLRASAWAGTSSPYSQIVTIDGITANSQVDLTPSVAQLVIFHQKDLAFVTENDNGVVTVYAIGDKPTNDYTMQVTITEVTT